MEAPCARNDETTQLDQLLQDVQTMDADFGLRISIEKSSRTGKFHTYSHSHFPDSICKQIEQLLSEDCGEQLDHACQDARLKVLSSIGLFLKDSKTLLFIPGQLLGMRSLYGGNYKFNLQELEALLWPVQSSAVLEQVWLGEYGSVLKTEESWVLLTDIIRGVKTLHTLVAYNAGILVPKLKLLAEAVVATSPSPLLKVDLRGNDIFNETGAEILVSILRAAPNLSELGVGPFKDAVGAKEIGLAVASHGSLETLFVEQGRIPDFGFPGQVSSSNITGEPEKTPTDHFLTATFGDGMRNTSIRHLYFEYSYSPWVPFSFGILPQLLGKDIHIAHLTVNGLNKGASTAEDSEWRALYKALSFNSTIKTLHVVGNVIGQAAEQEFLNWIRTAPLNCLTVESQVESLDAIPWSSTFRALRDNTSLHELKSLVRHRFSPEDFRELLAMLQVNSTLREVSMEDFSSHQAALVRQALKSKARQETYLVELRKGLAQTQWTSPRCGRLFLCGAGMAGKTRLALTMLNVGKEKSLRRRIRDKFLKRTEGVEIHTLINDESKQILIWDLAGQDIFRAMQEYLFPRLSRACIFLFVFSPVNHENKRVLCLEEAFEEELRTWLRFIASNSAVTGFNLPEVMVVVSHRDKAEDIDSNWTNNIVERLGTEFSDVIYIHTTPYFVDCRQTLHVQPIMERIYSAFDEAFKEKLFRVPAACYEMSKIIMEWTLQHKLRPVIHYDEFLDLCEKALDLRNLRTITSKEEDRVNALRAIAAYLHDVGTLIELPESPLMVVNPNWLTYEFLGSLVCVKEGFQRSSATRQVWASLKVEMKDGFLTRTAFRLFLQQYFLRPLHKKGFVSISLDTLETLMRSLGLCYEVSQPNSNPCFFVPTMFKAEIEHKLQWPKYDAPEAFSFYGLRVRCKDQHRTYLSSGFFSRFQITIWPKLREKLSLQATQMECKLDLIYLMADGHDIFVENDEGGGFIDIMIRSIKQPRPTWDFVGEYLLKELMDFCVSPRGSPGVELVVDILRRECVRDLSLRSHRRHQKVSTEELKEKLKDSIRRLTNATESDMYHHTWTSVPEANLQQAPEAAISLLPPSDVEEIKQWVLNETDALTERKDKLKAVASELEAQQQMDSMKLKPSPEKTQSTEVQEVHFEDPEQERIEQHFHDVKKGLHRVEQQIGDMRLEMRRVLAEVLELKSKIPAMITVQHEVLAKCNDLSSKLDTLIGVSDASTQFPKRPYFTRIDVGITQRITAFVEIGKPLILHFKCEVKSGNHIVEKQPGFELTVEKENREALRLVSRNAMRVIWYLVKAGLHIGAGLGGILPDLEMSDGSFTGLTLSSMTLILDTVQVQGNSTSVAHQDLASAEKAWRYLQDYLKPKLHNQITNYFLLHRAQYLDRDSTHVWLCEECLEKGINEGRVTKL